MQSLTADIELTVRTREGDPAAFAALWSRHRDATRVAASRLVPPNRTASLIHETRTSLERRVRAAPVEASFRFLVYDRLRTQAARSATVTPITLGRRGALCEAFEQTPTLRAFRDLDPWTQDVLWYTWVEPDPHAPDHLGVDPDVIPGQALAAQETFRATWLSSLAEDRHDEPACQDFLSQLVEEELGVVRIHGSRTGHRCVTCAVVDAEKDYAHEHFATLARSLLRNQTPREPTDAR